MMQRQRGVNLHAYLLQQLIFLARLLLGMNEGVWQPLRQMQSTQQTRPLLQVSQDLHQSRSGALHPLSPCLQTVVATIGLLRGRHRLPPPRSPFNPHPLNLSPTRPTHSQCRHLNIGQHPSPPHHLHQPHLAVPQSLVIDLPRARNNQYGLLLLLLSLTRMTRELVLVIRLLQPLL